MAGRTRRPETTTLPISGGDSLTVKKHLNAGEMRSMYALMQKVNDAGETHIDPIKVGLAKVLTYLVDWTIRDHDDLLIAIKGESHDMLLGALNSLDPEDYGEIVKVIDAHDDAMGLLRAAEKKASTGLVIQPAA